jgi:hypothetical protein
MYLEDDSQNNRHTNDHPTPNDSAIELHAVGNTYIPLPNEEQAPSAPVQAQTDQDADDYKDEAPDFIPRQPNVRIHRTLGSADPCGLYPKRKCPPGGVPLKEFHLDASPPTFL